MLLLSHSTLALSAEIVDKEPMSRSFIFQHSISVYLCLQCRINYKVIGEVGVESVGKFWKLCRVYMLNSLKLYLLRHFKSIKVSQFRGAKEESMGPSWVRAFSGGKSREKWVESAHGKDWLMWFCWVKLLLFRPSFLLYGVQNDNSPDKINKAPTLAVALKCWLSRGIPLGQIDKVGELSIHFRVDVTIERWRLLWPHDRCPPFCFGPLHRPCPRTCKLLPGFYLFNSLGISDEFLMRHSNSSAGR